DRPRALRDARAGRGRAQLGHGAGSSGPSRRAAGPRLAAQRGAAAAARGAARAERRREPTAVGVGLRAARGDRREDGPARAGGRGGGSRMSGRPEPREVAAAFLGLLRSPRFTAALATAGVGIAALAYPLVRLTGWPGYLAALCGLVALMAVVLFARRAELDRELPPISLLVFAAWAGISILWSEYQWVTLGGTAYLLAYAFVGVFIALTRDTIQIVRAWGDVLRIVLGVSLALEVFSGILIDAPIPFLGIQGRIAELGPISGVLHTRNQLG